MDLEAKEDALDAFSLGRARVIVTKPKLAGFGLNWQHARCVIFASVSHSYEQHYQAVRRAWRFGQTQPVTCHMILADTEGSVWNNVRRKAEDHDRMKRAMTLAMARAQASADLRRAYTRPSQITLPRFMEARHGA